jgi:hypothetical protein
MPLFIISIMKPSGILRAGEEEEDSSGRGGYN